jgi:hypothetical protein
MKKVDDYPKMIEPYINFILINKVQLDYRKKKFKCPRLKKVGKIKKIYS